MSLVGTSTNVMFKGYFEQNYGIEIGFGQWMQLAVPIGIAMLIVIWFGLTHVIYPCKLKQHDGIHTLITTQLKDMGNMRGGELRTLLVFAVTAFCWMFRKPIDNAIAAIELNDASIAIAAAIALFILPSGENKGERLLTWQDTKDVPWGILLLLGGGLTVAGYLNNTGVADWLGAHMTLLQDMPLWVILLVVTIAIIVLSELMSNVATLTAFLPVIIAIAATLGENPLTIAIPAALAASCAFMLPIATPPNAIVFGSGLLRISHLVKAGIIYNVLGVIIINILAWMLMPMVYDVVYGQAPAWVSPLDPSP